MSALRRRRDIAGAVPGTARRIACEVRAIRRRFAGEMPDDDETALSFI